MPISPLVYSAGRRDGQRQQKQRTSARDGAAARNAGALVGQLHSEPFEVLVVVRSGWVCRR
jgi:hypothetical protein